MLCDRCAQPIRPGEQYDTPFFDAASSARPSTLLHKVCPPKPGTRAYAEMLRRNRNNTDRPTT